MKAILLLLFLLLGAVGVVIKKRRTRTMAPTTPEKLYLYVSEANITSSKLEKDTCLLKIQYRKDNKVAVTSERRQFRPPTDYMFVGQVKYDRAWRKVYQISGANYMVDPDQSYP